jgi:hypothetical protein
MAATAAGSGCNVHGNDGESTDKIQTGHHGNQLLGHGGNRFDAAQNHTTHNNSEDQPNRPAIAVDGTCSPARYGANQHVCLIGLEHISST